MVIASLIGFALGMITVLRRSSHKSVPWLDQRPRLVPRELIDIKARYGISLAAIIQRALQLGLIDENLYRLFQLKRNASGWRKRDPGEYEGNEISRRFEQLVLRAAAEELISTSKAATLLKQPLSNVKAVLAEAA